MTVRKQTGDDGGTGEVAVAADGPAQPHLAGATSKGAKPKGRTIRLEPVRLEIPASTEKGTGALMLLSKRLRDVAEQLANKKSGDTIVVPIVMQHQEPGATNDVTKPGGRTAKVEEVELKVPTTAKAMADAFVQFAGDLQRVAGQPDGPKGNPIMKLPPINVIVSCNGGGDG